MGTTTYLRPGTETVLYSFSGPPDGAYPAAGVVLDTAGNLYGTTERGGTSTNCNTHDRTGACGTVFKVDATGTETVLYTFTGGADGAFPLAGLLRDAAGNLVGTSNPAFGYGTVFELTQ